ncbi:MAG: HEAT repeat domain-containing protein [Planctomycetota bacterium]
MRPRNLAGPARRLAALLCALGCAAACALPAADGEPLDRLRSPDVAVQIQALWEIANADAPPPHATAAIAALLTPTWDGRKRARWCLYALQKIGPSSATKYLPAYMAAQSFLDYTAPLPSPDSPQRRAPALSAELSGASDAVWRSCIEAVLAELPGANSERAQAAESCLEKMAAPPAVIVPLLANMLADSAEPRALRCQAATLIGIYGRFAGSVPPLAHGLRDRQPEVRLACAVALGQLDHPFDLYGQAIGPPRHPDPAGAAAALIPALTDDDPRVASMALVSLGALGPLSDAVTAQLAARYRQDSGPEVDQLLQILAEQGTAVAAPTFTVGLNALDAAQRVFSARQLAIFLRRLTATPAATPAAADPRPALAQALLASLTPRLGEDPDVVAAAADDLALLGPSAAAAAPALQAALKTPANAAAALALTQALHAVAPAAAPTAKELIAMATAAKDTAALIHVVQAFAASGHGGDDVGAALAVIAQDPEPSVRVAVAEALGVVRPGSKPGDECLANLALHDPDPGVRAAAKSAMESLAPAPASPAEPVPTPAPTSKPASAPASVPAPETAHPPVPAALQP